MTTVKDIIHQEAGNAIPNTTYRLGRKSKSMFYGSVIAFLLCTLGRDLFPDSFRYWNEIWLATVISSLVFGMTHSSWVHFLSIHFKKYENNNPASDSVLQRIAESSEIPQKLKARIAEILVERGWISYKELRELDSDWHKRVAQQDGVGFKKLCGFLGKE